MMVVQPSLNSFLLATLYQIGYFCFYYDEALLAMKGTRVPELTLISQDGQFNMNFLPALLAEF